MRLIESLASKVSIAVELLEFFWQNKWWWLLPMIIVLLLFSVLVFFAASPVIGPFIYAPF